MVRKEHVGGGKFSPPINTKWGGEACACSNGANLEIESRESIPSLWGRGGAQNLSKKRSGLVVVQEMPLGRGGGSGGCSSKSGRRASGSERKIGKRPQKSSTHWVDGRLSNLAADSV